MSSATNIARNINATRSIVNQGNNNINIYFDGAKFNDVEAVLSHIKKLSATSPRRIHEITCDRTEIMTRYQSYFGEAFQSKPEPFYFFALPAFPGQQANSLIERMTYDLYDVGERRKKITWNQENGKFKFIKWVSGASDSERQYKFRQDLLKALGLNFPEDWQRGWSFSLCHLNEISSAVLDYDFISIAFKIDLDDLKPALIEKFISWIVTDFVKGYSPSPVFVFFLLIELPLKTPSGFSGLLNKFGLGSDENIYEPLIKLEKKFSESDRTVILGPLGEVTLKHIDEYFEEKIPTEIVRWRYIQEFMNSEGKTFTVDEMRKFIIPMTNGEFMIQTILKKLDQEEK